MRICNFQKSFMELKIILYPVHGQDLEDPLNLVRVTPYVWRGPCIKIRGTPH